MQVAYASKVSMSTSAAVMGQTAGHGFAAHEVGNGKWRLTHIRSGLAVALVPSLPDAKLVVSSIWKHLYKSALKERLPYRASLAFDTSVMAYLHHVSQLDTSPVPLYPLQPTQSTSRIWSWLFGALMIALLPMSCDGCPPPTDEYGSGSAEGHGKW